MLRLANNLIRILLHLINNYNFYIISRMLPVLFNITSLILLYGECNGNLIMNLMISSVPPVNFITTHNESLVESFSLYNITSINTVISGKMNGEFLSQIVPLGQGDTNYTFDYKCKSELDGTINIAAILIVVFISLILCVFFRSMKDRKFRGSLLN